MNVSVIGIGRIGLPVSAWIASRGHTVFGCDIDAARVAMVNRGENPIPDEAGLGALIRTVVDSGKLVATGDTAGSVAKSQAVLFAVAVDVDDSGRADLRNLLSAADDVARGLQPGTLCIFDTTLPVGTTRKVLAPRLEAGGLRIGRDIFVAFSPERVDPGNPVYNTHNTPKVVGGITANCTELATALYASCIETIVPVSSTEVAELVKLQHDDGGWSLPSLGTYARRDKSANDPKAESDGYATGFVSFVLKRADANHPAFSKGVAWLKSNQRESGRWFTRSLNNDKAHYIANAGTAFAVMAIQSAAEKTASK